MSITHVSATHVIQLYFYTYNTPKTPHMCSTTGNLLKVTQAYQLINICSAKTHNYQETNPCTAKVAHNYQLTNPCTSRSGSQLSANTPLHC